MAFITYLELPQKLSRDTEVNWSPSVRESPHGTEDRAESIGDHSDRRNLWSDAYPCRDLRSVREAHFIWVIAG